MFSTIHKRLVFLKSSLLTTIPQFFSTQMEKCQAFCIESLRTLRFFSRLELCCEVEIQRCFLKTFCFFFFIYKIFICPYVCMYVYWNTYIFNDSLFLSHDFMFLVYQSILNCLFEFIFQPKV